MAGQPLPASQEWEEVELDNGKGRSPNLCLKGEFCPYGHVTYAFGRNNYGQLGVGDRQTRNIPTPIPTAYLKVNALASGDQSNILTSEGRKELYAWGRDDHGQLGQGPTFNDTLPNRIYMGRPVLITMGGQHSLISTPPAPANMFDNDDFAGKAQEFVHYGDSSQPIAPSEACPRCTPWEQTPVPKPDDQKYKGRLCQSPPWSEGSGVPIVGVWCFIQKGGDKPCRLAVKAPFESGKDWWIHACNDLAKFSITPDPPIRLSAGAVWRKAKVQIYQPWRMSVFFKIRRCETVTQGGNGFVVVIQNHGIDPEHNPIGSTGSDMGLARSTRYSFNDGVPNSFGVEVRTVDSNGAIEIRACYGGAYTTDNSLAENARCQIAISYWKPDRLCNPLDPDTCCTDAEIRETNKCFKEDLKDEAPHELTILYSPFAMQVYLDDARFPKIKVDVDIREHVKSYECKSGPNEGKRCECNGDLVCGGVLDVESCLEGHECEVSGMAWVGITAATGDAFCVHEVESWNFINLGQDGGVVSFGKNLYGQLGLADARDRNVGNLIVGLDGMVVAVMAAGKSHSIILTISGNVYTWGGNHFGQLGQGDTNIRLVPTKVRFLDALRTSAEIGDPCVCTRIVLNCQSMPRVDPCVFEVVHVAAGAYHSLVVVKRDNDAHEIYGWGDNSFGQLGCIEILGSVECPWVLKPPGTVGNWPTDEVLKEPCSPTNPRCTASPRKLAMFDRYGRQAMVFNFHSLEVGAFHNVLITKDCPKCPMPSLCANEKISREECDCDAGARKRTNVAKLWMLDSADCIAKDREIYTWGSNLRGQLGNNCSDSAHHDYVYKGPNHLVCPDSPIPIRLNSPRKIHLLPFYPDVFRYRPNPANPLLPIMINKPVAAIVGGFHNLLLFDDQSLLVWGSNYFGQLGLGDFRHRIYPVNNNYFSRRFLTPPNLAPRDGKGNSITTLPNKVLSAQRDVLVVSAGEQHTIVTTNCIGGGFKGPRTGELTSEWMPDGSCDCMFGWKGPDCNIQCNGGANTSCLCSSSSPSLPPLYLWLAVSLWPHLT